MKTARVAIALLFAICLAVPLAACGGGGSTPAAGKIAFHSDRDGNDEVYPFHMSLVKHGRRICKAQRPLCPRCVLAFGCPSAVL